MSSRSFLPILTSLLLLSGIALPENSCLAAVIPPENAIGIWQGNTFIGRDNICYYQIAMDASNHLVGNDGMIVTVFVDFIDGDGDPMSSATGKTEPFGSAMFDRYTSIEIGGSCYAKLLRISGVKANYDGAEHDLFSEKSAQILDYQPLPVLRPTPRYSCDEKLINTVSVEGVYSGLDYDENGACHVLILTDSRKEIAFIVNKDEAEKWDNLKTGQRVAIEYEVRQFWNAPYDECSRRETILSSKQVTATKTQNESPAK